MSWLSVLGLDGLAARWRANAIEGAIAVEDRLELAQLEWLEQKQRLQQLLVLGIAMATLTVVVLIVLSMAVMVHFWETPYRLTAAWLMAAAGVVAWGGVLLSLRSVSRRAGQGFALTRQELAKDWRALKERL